MKNNRELIISNIEKEFSGNTIDLENNQMTISLKNKLRVNLVIEEEQVIVTPESSLFGLYYLSKKNRLILENAINRIKNILAIENIDPIIITRYA